QAKRILWVHPISRQPGNRHQKYTQRQEYVCHYAHRGRQVVVLPTTCHDPGWFGDYHFPVDRLDEKPGRPDECLWYQCAFSQLHIEQIGDYQTEEGLLERGGEDA